jgi:16S rRNA U516 pseudouridylate synthase RsuA-like enzyme
MLPTTSTRLVNSVGTEGGDDGDVRLSRPKQYSGLAPRSTSCDPQITLTEGRNRQMRRMVDAAQFAAAIVPPAISH